ncbi:hypothetical protein B484DRAFT_103174 [Ochromonadaceae sp. CCMP2298]|nr:hypothetical protein B484DRAFT_103174 [Ochromonadaceae sp. CCMP2298]
MEGAEESKAVNWSAMAYDDLHSPSKQYLIKHSQAEYVSPLKRSSNLIGDRYTASSVPAVSVSRELADLQALQDRLNWGVLAPAKAVPKDVSYKSQLAKSRFLSLFLVMRRVSAKQQGISKKRRFQQWVAWSKHWLYLYRSRLDDNHLHPDTSHNSHNSNTHSQSLSHRSLSPSTSHSTSLSPSRSSVHFRPSSPSPSPSRSSVGSPSPHINHHHPANYHFHGDKSLSPQQMRRETYLHHDMYLSTQDDDVEQVAMHHLHGHTMNHPELEYHPLHGPEHHAKTRGEIKHAHSVYSHIVGKRQTLTLAQAQAQTAQKAQAKAQAQAQVQAEVQAQVQTPPQKSQVPVGGGSGGSGRGRSSLRDSQTPQIERAEKERVERVERVVPPPPPQPMLSVFASPRDRARHKREEEERRVREGAGAVGAGAVGSPSTVQGQGQGTRSQSPNAHYRGNGGNGGTGLGGNVRGLQYSPRSPRPGSVSASTPASASVLVSPEKGKDKDRGDRGDRCDRGDKREGGEKGGDKGGDMSTPVSTRYPPTPPLTAPSPSPQRIQTHALRSPRAKSPTPGDRSKLHHNNGISYTTHAGGGVMSTCTDSRNPLSPQNRASHSPLRALSPAHAQTVAGMGMGGSGVGGNRGGSVGRGGGVGVSAGGSAGGMRTGPKALARALAVLTTHSSDVTHNLHPDRSAHLERNNHHHVLRRTLTVLTMAGQHGSFSSASASGSESDSSESSERGRIRSRDLSTPKSFKSAVSRLSRASSSPSMRCSALSMRGSALHPTVSTIVKMAHRAEHFHRVASHRSLRGDDQGYVKQTKVMHSCIIAHY